ncbi:MAG: hypothetical protein J7L50_01470 [Candidatus Odinarchaeota archaeon]|nr:hypothetical protein [Candidatus Odinarchaeota archaeon]
MFFIKFMRKLDTYFRINLGRMISFMGSEGLEDALFYIRKNYGIELRKEGLLNSSILISTFISTSVFLIASNVGFPPLVSLSFSIVVFLVSSFYLVNYPITLLRREVMRLSRYLYLVFSELHLSLELGTSKFDTIRYMAKSDIPEVSQMFENMVKEMICGGTLEDTMRKSVEKLPPCELKDMISDFFSNSGMEFLRKYDLEYLKEYRRYVSEVENRMIIFYILPIFIVVVSSIFSYHLFFTSHLLFILYLLLIVSLSKGLEIMAMRNSSGRLLRGYGRILSERKELKDAIDLTNKMGKMLQSGIPLETSMMKLLSEYRGENRERIREMVYRMSLLEKSPEDVILFLSKMFSTPIVKHTLIMASSNIKRDDGKFGKIMIRVSKHLSEVKNLLDEEFIVYRANQLKSMVIIVVSSLIIGLASSISLFISNFYVEGLFSLNLGLSLDYPIFPSMAIFLTHSYLSGRLSIVNFERSKAYILTLSSFFFSFVSSQITWSFLTGLLSMSL